MIWLIIWQFILSFYNYYIVIRVHIIACVKHWSVSLFRAVFNPSVVNFVHKHVARLHKWMSPLIIQSKPTQFVEAIKITFWFYRNSDSNSQFLWLNSLVFSDPIHWDLSDQLSERLIRLILHKIYSRIELGSGWFRAVYSHHRQFQAQLII